MDNQKRVESLKRRYGRNVAPAKRRGPMGGPGHGRQHGKGGMPKNSRETIRRLLSYLNGYKLHMGLAFFCVIVNTVATLTGSYMLRPIINKYIAPMDGSRGSVGGLAASLVFMAAIYFIGVVANYAQSRVMLTVAQNALQKIRDELFTKMQKLPVRFYDTNNNGDLMSRFTNDVDTVGQMLSSTLVQLFSGALSIVGTLALMIYTNIWLTLVTVFMIPLMMKAGGYVAGKSQKYFSAQQTSLGAVNGYIEETISGQKVVKVFCHEDIAEEEFEILNEDLRDNMIKAQFFGGMMGPVMSNLSQLNYTLTAAIGGLLCVLRGFDVGGLTVFLNFSRQFSRPINEISMQISNVFSALAGAERVFAVMDEEPEPVDDGDAAVLNPMKGYVELKDVTFGYNPEKTILKDISLYAKPGQKIAFVGSTGAGKTTITNLLNRFYDIQSGSITIDGVNIRHINRDNLRQNIAMVLQDTHLFTGTVMENIRYGRLDATDEEVIQAAKTASAYSFIMRLPHGFDTVLEGDGANLSQGQRQLLNIARAAISKAPILILDEATSSVDTRTEKHIEHGMDRLMADRTTFVIAHRLSTVRNANAIMVLENGEIIERGDHDDLLAQKGRYYELTVFLNFSRQFSRPINEISMQISNVFSALAGAERVFAVMDEEPEPVDDGDAAVLNPMKGYVELKDVTFGYNPEKTILKDISLYAKPGQKIAFVGSTGAGKTTITNLLNRFYDIQSGSITIDGVNIRHINRDNLRQNIAMVLQDTHLFTGTVMENIRYGRLDATDEEVIQAAKTASAYSFIMRLPHGFDTVLEGDGANLSQGQRQLLNIARAAISKAPILILDEATSSVDTRTEKHIEHGMDRLMADRTTFVIAHRLSTVRNANAIMVLENGEIIERGDHDDLLAQKGRYYELYTGVKELD